MPGLAIIISGVVALGFQQDCNSGGIVVHHMIMKRRVSLCVCLVHIGFGFNVFGEGRGDIRECLDAI